jgi:hypothetical protein
MDQNPKTIATRDGFEEILVHDTRKLEASQFMLHGRRVQETICRDMAEGLDKLVWCFFPLVDVFTSDGMPNVLVHIDFQSRNKDAEKTARAKVRLAFCKHWNLEDSMR